ncbi:MAG: hypothetical protein KKF65_07170, partial [Nanoarchaeota archaeon]|nr:hypothetical protein [Nanoarchaeota archaeon]
DIIENNKKVDTNEKVKVSIKTKEKLFDRVFGIGKTNKKIDVEKEILEIKRGWNNERLFL